MSAGQSDQVPSGDPTCQACIFRFVFTPPPPPPTFLFFFVFIQTVVWKHLQRPGADGRLGLLRWVQQDLRGGAVCGGRAGTELACLSAGDSFTCQTRPKVSAMPMSQEPRQKGVKCDALPPLPVFMCTSQRRSTVTVLREAILFS